MDALDWVLHFQKNAEMGEEGGGNTKVKYLQNFYVQQLLPSVCKSI